MPQWMPVLDLALVGTGGMMPLPDRWLASILVRWGRHLVLFDCGEGTQISLRQLGWGIKDIDLILVSHLHGDHVGGLPGLLLSQGNAGRTLPVDILGPPGLTQTVAALRTIAPYLPFEVRCRDLEGGVRHALDEMTVTTAAGDHGVPCLAYRLDVPRRPRFLVERARSLGVPRERWKVLQDGRAVAVDGRTIQPEQVLGPPRRGLSVAMATDTRPTEAIARLIEGVDLFACEGTYALDEERPRAVERKHMTFGEAAELARRSHVGRLVLTHFSPAVTDPWQHLSIAAAIHPDTVVGRDHLTFRLTFPED